MKRVIAALFAALLWTAPALAQSGPIFAGLQSQCTGGGSFSLNPGDKDPNAVLSNSNLTIQQSASTLGNNTMARGTKSFSSGKFYFEFNPTAGNTGHHGLGWANSSQSINNNFLGDSANSFEYATNGFAFYNGATSTALISSPTGLNTTVGVAFDIGNLLLWVTDDGTNFNTALGGTQNPSTGQGGFSLSGLLNAGPYFPSAGVGGDTVQDSETVNFGGSAFAYSVPTGFKSPFSTSTSACAPPPSSSTRNFLVGIKTSQTLVAGVSTTTYQGFVGDSLVADSWAGFVGNGFFIGNASSDTAFSNQPAPTSLKIIRALSLTTNVSSGGNTDLQNLIAGNYDPQIIASLQTIATDHNTNGYDTVAIRAGWENGGGGCQFRFGWTGCDTDGPTYVAAQRHVCNLIRIYAPFAKIDWNANLQSDNLGVNGAERSWRAYYPGDDCVDIISTDLYFSTNGQGGANLNASTNFAAVRSGGTWGTQVSRTGITGPAGIDFMDNFAASTFCTNCPAGQSGGSKLMGFGELGAGGAGGAAGTTYSPAGFITQLAQWMLARNSRMAYAIWWDGNDSGSTAIESDPAAITAWQNAFNSLTFNGSWTQYIFFFFVMAPRRRRTQ